MNVYPDDLYLGFGEPGKRSRLVLAVDGKRITYSVPSGRQTRCSLYSFAEWIVNARARLVARDPKHRSAA